MKMNVKSISMIQSLKNKRLLMVLCCIIMTLFLISAVFILNAPPRKTIINGTLFIDSIPASMGLEVKIAFSDNVILDPDGTDEQGQYSIDISGFSDKVGTFYINYNGSIYPLQNYSRDIIDMKLIGSTEFLELNLFFYTTNTDSSEYNNSRSSIPNGP